MEKNYFLFIFAFNILKISSFVNSLQNPIKTLEKIVLKNVISLIN